MPVFSETHFAKLSCTKYWAGVLYITMLIRIIKEEIRRLEMEGDFEAGAKLRQQLRDVRRAEKKAAEEAASKAAANAEQGCEPLPL